MKKWYESGGADGDVAVSTRVRLARNFANYPFPGRMSAKQAAEVLTLVSDKMRSSAAGTEFRLGDLSRPAEAEALVERHLISPELARAERPKGVVLSRDDSVSVMINEEDHLRIQVMGAGSCLRSCMDRAEIIDRLLEEGEKLAFDEKKGYLTACPTNLGTGLRAGVMLHLPALTMSGGIRAIIASAGKVGFAVRGLYGEGSKAAGAMYQFSNQLTLGMTEEETLARLSDAVSSIIGSERRARAAMKAEQPSALADRVWRAAGILATARLLTSEEARNLLSDLRLGVSVGELAGITIEEINVLTWEAGPTVIASLMGGGGQSQDRDKKRAELLRAAVAPVFGVREN